MQTTPVEVRENSVHDLGAATVTVLERDGTRPVLLLHGGAGPGSVLPFAELLAAHRHTRVIVPTHPGFAGSPRPAGPASIRGLAQLYAGLLERLGVHDVTVVGNSIGGWVAAELALLGSARISGAVLVDAVGLDVPEHPIADVSGLTAAQLAALSFHEPDRFPPAPSRPGPDLSALAAYTRMSMTDPTLGDRLAKLDLPVRVIWGAADGIATPAYGRAYAAAIPGATFTLLPDAGHLPQLEAPGQLLAAIGLPQTSS